MKIIFQNKKKNKKIKNTGVCKFDSSMILGLFQAERAEVISLFCLVSHKYWCRTNLVKATYDCLCGGLR